MHSGVKYIDRNSSQPASVIPAGATLDDIIVPVDNVDYSEYTGWYTSGLIPNYYNSLEDYNQGAPEYVGKTMKIMMPIYLEDVKNDYTFTFKINELLPLSR